VSGTPLRFDEFQDQALYDPGSGFFAAGGRAGGRGGDFITSAEIGPLFGVVLASAITRWWRELGSPEQWSVVEAGAGRGALAAAILSVGLPPGARYVLVERSAALRAEAIELLGDRVEARERMPDAPITGVILANELLDNLPTRIVERATDGWAEVWVDAEGGDEIRTGPDVPEPVLDGDVPLGTRLPVVEQAMTWVADALGILSSGRLVVVDYGVRTTVELVGRQWLRTFREHGRGSDPLVAPGSSDITIDVPFDQLPAPRRIVTQREFLVEHGIDDLVEEGRRVWRERAHIGDLDAVRHRSRITEAEALLDPDGLGGFLVAEWVHP
jgi:SAM-dependent MidA family methyltransferase